MPPNRTSRDNQSVYILDISYTEQQHQQQQCQPSLGNLQVKLVCWGELHETWFWSCTGCSVTRGAQWRFLVLTWGYRCAYYTYKHSHMQLHAKGIIRMHKRGLIGFVDMFDPTVVFHNELFACWQWRPVSLLQNHKFIWPISNLAGYLIFIFVFLKHWTKNKKLTPCLRWLHC